MADIDLAAIRERAEKATPGPWQTGAPTPDAGAVYFGTTADPDDPNEPGVLLGDAPPADAEFIAHARTDIPALLDEIDRLQAGRNFEQSMLRAAVEQLGRVNDVIDEHQKPLELDRRCECDLCKIGRIIDGGEA